MVGDSLIGEQEGGSGGRVAVPLRAVRRVEVRRFDAWRTVWATMLTAAVLYALLTVYVFWAMSSEAT